MDANGEGLRQIGSFGGDTVAGGVNIKGQAGTLLQRERPDAFIRVLMP